MKVFESYVDDDLLVRCLVCYHVFYVDPGTEENLYRVWENGRVVLKEQCPECGTREL